MAQTRTQEFVTPLELAWLDLLRRAMSQSSSGVLVFEEVNVKDGRVWAKRALESIVCAAAPVSSEPQFRR